MEKCVNCANCLHDNKETGLTHVCWCNDSEVFDSDIACDDFISQD